MVEALMEEVDRRATEQHDEVLRRLLFTIDAKKVEKTHYCIRCDRYLQYYTHAAILLTKAKRAYRMFGLTEENRYSRALRDYQHNQNLYHNTPCTCGGPSQ